MIKWLLLLPIICFSILLGLHPFLAITRPVSTNILVVEGWLPKESLEFAAHLYRTQDYQLILTNGGTSESAKGKAKIATFAESSKNQLVSMGIDERHVVAVSTGSIGKSRTFSYARSIVEWLTIHKKSTRAINVLTLDAHARKSYVLYKKAAAGKTIEVGIISAPPVEYRPQLWFFSIYGIGFVIKNLTGYIYALTV